MTALPYFLLIIKIFVNIARNGDDYLRKSSSLRNGNRHRYLPLYNTKNSRATYSGISTHLYNCAESWYLIEMPSECHFSLCINKQKVTYCRWSKKLIISMCNLLNFNNRYVCVLVFNYGTMSQNSWKVRTFQQS